MNDSGFRNGAFLGGIIGASLGMVFGTKMSPMRKRKVMRTARKAGLTLKNGMNFLWK
ncbi:MAG: hypothetical protein GX329_03055 [Tissierellia bacterium]|nr:hypothetical protein [Tissierellia bacterium]